MDMRFQGVCERAAAQWEVPALVAGTSIGGREEVVPVGCEPDDRFRIASITKCVTALTALAVLDPDERTGVWPEDVCVRHLLSHTSGFDCELPDGDNARFGDDDGALGRCAAALPGVRRLVGAEDVWSYANTGYWLVGWLTAERAGETYEDAVARQVLGPAGLDATAFDEPGLAGTGRLALADPYPRSRRPSGGLTSTIGDLLRLGRFLLGSPQLAQLTAAHGRPIAGVYGFGLAGERVGGVEVWGHGGSYGGFQSTLLLVPSLDAVFAGLSNSSLGTKALRTIEDAFLEETTGARRPEASYRTLEPGAYDAFAGTYENSDGRYTVEPAGEGLVVHVGDEELIGLAIDERTFQVPAGEHVNERFDFPRAGLGRFGSRLATQVA